MSIEAKKRKKPVIVTNGMILDYLKENPNSSAAKMAMHFNASGSVMFTKLNNLVDKEEISMHVATSPTGRGIRYYKLTDVKANEPVNVEEEPRVEEVQKVISLFTPKDTMPSLDTLITEAAHNIAQKMLIQIKEELMMGLEDLVVEVAPRVNKKITETKSSVKKVKVLITGLLAHQAGIISSEFHECFDLDFWNDRTGGSTEQLKSMAKRADVILYHKNHASHNHQEIIKSVGGNIKIINGGMSTMKDALEDMYINGVK